MKALSKAPPTPLLFLVFGCAQVLAMPRCSDSDAESQEAPQSWNAITEALKRVAALHGQLEQQARVVSTC